MNPVVVGATVGGVIGLCGACIYGTIAAFVAGEDISKGIAFFGGLPVGGAAVGAGLGWVVKKVI